MTGSTALTLEHYPAMTLRQLEAIAAEAEARWPLLAGTIIHRHGRLLPGEPIVLVITASPHRAAAFEAAEFLMDWLKTRAPFWKHDGSGWVAAKASDDDAAARWETAPMTRSPSSTSSASRPFATRCGAPCS